jgi:hypothetical protein
MFRPHFGDLIGSGASQEQGIVGETPNLAARLQGIAGPNGVVIAEGTRKLIGNLFELEDLGAKDLKGVGGPARVWAAVRPSSVESRFEVEILCCCPAAHSRVRHDRDPPVILRINLIINCPADAIVL